MTTDNTTDITDVPDGWTNDAELCTGDEYSECSTSADCELRVAPGCSCYVSSCIHPYDPCDGDDVVMVYQAAQAMSVVSTRQYVRLQMERVAHA